MFKILIQKLPNRREPSRRTRIETYCWCDSTRKRIEIDGNHPEEQGLKHAMAQKAGMDPESTGTIQKNKD